DDTSNLQSLPDHVKYPILVGFSNAMDLVFFVGAMVMLVGVVLSACMKEVPLRSQSGQQARAAAEQRAQLAAAKTPAAAAASAAPADVVPLTTRTDGAVRSADG